MAIPTSVEWKVFRSKTHCQELVAEVEHYFKTNPGRVVRESGGNPDEFIGTFQPGGPVPGRLSIIIGDCLQNLRSALDYLVWELVLAGKNEPGRHNMFPVCSTPEAFDDQLIKRRRLDGVGPGVVEEIRGLQPYHRGKIFDKTMLWVLDDLCNINKHRRVLLTDLRGGPGEFRFEYENGEPVCRIISMNKGAKIGPFPIIGGPEGRGVKIDSGPQFAAFIALNEVVGQDIEITTFLFEMLTYVERNLLPRFDRFFV